MGELAERWERYLGEHRGHPPLDEACAMLAAEEGSSATVEGVREALDALAMGAGSSDPRTALARLIHRLFVDEGLRGEEVEYDHPGNSCIDDVLIRRQGLPLLLSIITSEVGRRVGVPRAGQGISGVSHAARLDGCRGLQRAGFRASRCSRSRRTIQTQHWQWLVMKVCVVPPKCT